MVDNKEPVDLYRGLNGTVTTIECALLIGSSIEGLSYHTVHERALSSARNAGDGDETSQRNGNVEGFEVVLGRATNR